MLSEFLTEPVFTKGLSVSSNSAIWPHFLFHAYTLCVCVRAHQLIVSHCQSHCDWYVCVRIFCIKLVSHYLWCVLILLFPKADLTRCLHIFFSALSVDILITANATCWHILMSYHLFLTDFSLQSYLNTFAFKNTVYTDLWDHLQRVSENEHTTAINLHDSSGQCGCACVSSNVTLFVFRQLKAHQV